MFFQGIQKSSCCIHSTQHCVCAQDALQPPGAGAFICIQLAYGVLSSLGTLGIAFSVKRSLPDKRGNESCVEAHMTDRQTVQGIVINSTASSEQPVSAQRCIRPSRQG